MPTTNQPAATGRHTRHQHSSPASHHSPTAETMRRPQLQAALANGHCSLLSLPAEDPFEREKSETTESWHTRRQLTIQNICGGCPAAAACEELALRDRAYTGVRGGLTEEELRQRARKQATRLAAARKADNHLHDQDTQIRQAYRQLNRACAVNSDRYKASAPQRHAAVTTARSKLAHLQAARRTENGWGAQR
ncbi:WhiB family transcriptional regulator [Kitasatospora sp. MBT66]|uniref:WhiB family transcriptional regulator n=1 Tax=Kitasatospora sp. MBT66 TaxID=1444769 RepID=UPI0005B7752A|nr:WhiB family transcriptional regulator [Kitasatospora sp. MBT66]